MLKLDLNKIRFKKCILEDVEPGELYVLNTELYKLNSYHGYNVHVKKDSKFSYDMTAYKLIYEDEMEKEVKAPISSDVIEEMFE